MAKHYKHVYDGMEAQTAPSGDLHPENAPETERDWKAAARAAGWDFDDGRPPEEHGLPQAGLETRTTPPRVQ